MTARMREPHRRAVALRRRPPGESERLVFAADGNGDHGDAAGRPPDEITLELTDAAGEVAGWCDDAWWLEALRRWKERSLSVHVAPTPDALSHPVGLHYLEMLRRVVPAWRVIAEIALCEVSDDMIAHLAALPCHELRIIDRPFTSTEASRLTSIRIDELFGRLREAQARLGVTRPALVRMPALPGRSELTSVPPASAFVAAEST